MERKGWTALALLFVAFLFINCKAGDGMEFLFGSDETEWGFLEAQADPKIFYRSLLPKPICNNVGGPYNCLGNPVNQLNRGCKKYYSCRSGR